MGAFLEFGETREEFSYKVINEREARASAGIMFLLGMMSLYSVFISKSLFWAELFSITFIVEFFIRTLINPRYAPYMVLSSFIVSNQTPEWVEAKPKQFAWILGALLGVIMTAYIVSDTTSPVRLLTCVLCLALLFFESALGICLGCIVYRKLNIKVENCPGGACERKNKMENKKGKALLLLGFVALFLGTYYMLKDYKYNNHSTQTLQTNVQQNNLLKEEDENCNPPQWAIDIGHGELWKEHHGCK